MSNPYARRVGDDAELDKAETELIASRKALVEEQEACGSERTQGNCHRLAQAHSQLAGSFEHLAQLHRGIADDFTSDYPDS